MFNGSKMKRFVSIVAIIMAASFIIAGIIYAAEYGKNGFNFTMNSALMGNAIKVDEEKSEDISGINNVNVNTSTENITFTPTDSDTVKAHFYGSYSSGNKEFKPEFIVTKTGDTLDIKINFKAYFVINYSSDMKLDIYLPKSYSGNLKVDTDTANINTDEMNLESFTGKTSTGNLYARLINAKSSKISTDTGNVKINGTFDSFSFNSSTGDLSSDNIVSKDTKLVTDTGKMTLNGNPGNVDSSSSTGDLSLNYNEFASNITAHSDTGSTTIRLPAKAEFHLKFNSDTGNVKCDFPVTITGKQRDNSLDGTVISDSNIITVKSSTGNLDITK